MVSVLCHTPVSLTSFSDVVFHGSISSGRECSIRNVAHVVSFHQPQQSHKEYFTTFCSLTVISWPGGSKEVPLLLLLPVTHRLEVML